MEQENRNEKSMNDKEERTMKNSKNEFNKATISEQKTGNYNAVQGNRDGNSDTGSHSSITAELPLHMVTEFLKVKEHEFMEEYTNKPLVEMLLELGLGLLSLDDLEILQQELYYRFVAHLFDDSEFRELTVLSHFYKSDGTHFFGLAPLGSYSPCVYGSENTYDWVALLVNVNDGNIISLNCFSLPDSEKVEDSIFVGNSVHFMIQQLFVK